ncbi:Autophagy-related protein 30 [Cyberlindnera fabianii]|uniref:Autophagy-related protein 30 n=1 Tax=Cyberlindnera fabianii TaxID=36022 RepID=A0A1V2LAB5_CYBFA|nr:Autophagy-related protein 30 [Cyberlindnera fabianii]
MNQNAYIKEHRREPSPQQDTASIAQTSSSNQRRLYDELSSSGVDSDWILFSPLSDVESPVHGDVLSTSTGDMPRVESLSDDEDLSEEQEEHEEEQEEEDDDDDEEDDDDDSLIESLGTNMPLSMPVGDGTGSFVTRSLAASSQKTQPETEEYDYLQSLDKEDFVTHRIDMWRKEQAKAMINDLHRESFTSATSTEKSAELLASWGVDDSMMMNGGVFEDDEKPRATSRGNKRFYGDDLFKGYNTWEVNKIKRVAQQLSSSLVRDNRATSSIPPVTTSFRARRSSLLLNLSRSANKYFIGNATAFEPDMPFWKRDISSANSSLSMSVNSIMFGNLNIGETA